MPVVQLIPPVKTMVWRGTKDIQEAPDSPILDHDQSGLKWTRTFNGPFKTLQAARPLRLQSMSGFPGFFVDQARVQQGKGGTGTMTIVLTTAPLPDPDSGVPPPVLEIEWVELSKHLETNSRYQPGGDNELSNTDFDKIEEWKNQSTASTRASLYAEICILHGRGHRSAALTKPPLNALRAS